MNWVVRALRAVNQRFPNPLVLGVVWMCISLVLVGGVVFALQLLGDRTAWWVLAGACALGALWFAGGSRRGRDLDRDAESQRQQSVLILTGFAIIAFARAAFLS